MNSFLVSLALVVIVGCASRPASPAERAMTLNGKVAFELPEGEGVKQAVSVDVVIGEGDSRSITLVRGPSRDTYWNYTRVDENGAMMLYTFYRKIRGFEANGMVTNIVFKGRRVVLSSATGASIYQGEVLKVSDAELAMAGMTLEESFDNLVKNGRLDAVWTYFGLYDWK